MLTDAGAVARTQRMGGDPEPSYSPAMSELTVSVDLDATPEEVWGYVEDVASHVEWMEDAVAIRFTSSQTSGVGTTFDCDTAIGPFRLVDHMEITEWVPAAAMGVRHVGMVTGSGVFRLEPLDAGRRTRFTWTEELTFPWWMGGPLGARIARPVLGHVWRRNLVNLQSAVGDHVRRASAST
ncbi:MAG: SRPBCC family protein [Actinobacteria bacterium]|nr:SRPBCC family protein [Actinomycetota bacterium]